MTSHPMKPMPTTGMPDRVDPKMQTEPKDLKAGMTSKGNGDPTRKK
jgi:hypothetical protein